MDLKPKQDSYAERRLLFKNIWDTAMNINEADVDIMAKPKVIKTLRLDEVDRCVIGKRKKERIKNLRAVCNKILDFCDRQDADDIFYEQVNLDVNQALKQNCKNRKVRTYRRRRATKAKTSLEPKDDGGAKATTSECKDDSPENLIITSGKSPIKKRFTVVQRTEIKQRLPMANSDLDAGESNVSGEKNTVRRKKIRKKINRRKKTSASKNGNTPRPSGTTNTVRYVSTPLSGRAIVKRITQLLTDSKISVT